MFKKFFIFCFFSWRFKNLWFFFCVLSALFSFLLIFFYPIPLFFAVFFDLITGKLLPLSIVPEKYHVASTGSRPLNDNIECSSISLTLNNTILKFDSSTNLDNSANNYLAESKHIPLKTTITSGSSSAGGSTALMPTAANGSQTLTMKTVTNTKNKITLKNNHQMQCLSILDSNDCLKTPTVPDMLKTPTINTSSKSSNNFINHGDELDTPSICLSSLAPKNHSQAFFGDHEPLLNGELILCKVFLFFKSQLNVCQIQQN